MKKYIGIVALIIVLGVWYTTYQTMDYFNGTIEKEDDCYSLTFDLMNRTETYSFNLQANSMICVETKIEKGELNIKITNENEDIIYQGNDVENGIFEVFAKTDGNMKLLLRENTLADILNLK